MLIRIAASFLLLFSMLFMPFCVTALLALTGIIYFTFYWEVAVIFFLSDLLYGTKEAKFHGEIFILFFVVLFVVLLAEILKRKLKFYK